VDKKIFLALMALAVASGSPALAQQVRAAEQAGQLHQVSRTEVLRAVYRLSLSGNSGAGLQPLIALGHSPEEARQMIDLTTSIARKAGSAENFMMIASGGVASKDFKLSAREEAMLRSVAARVSGGNGGPGRTWEGSELAVAKPRPIGAAINWDGRTWEGNALTSTAAARQIPTEKR